MSYYNFRLKAGVPFRVNVSGKMILVDDVDGAAGVDITPIRGGSNQRTMPKRKKAFKFWIEYDAIELEAETDCSVSMFLSFTDVSLGFADGALVNVVGGVSIVNDPGSRVPVDLAGGNVEVTATNVGISNTDAAPVPTKAKLAGAVAHSEPVGVGVVAVKVLEPSATRRGARFRNAGAAPFAIGGAGVTFAAATDIVMPGETWNEIDAPGAAWYAICEAGSASTINISTVE